MPAASSDGMFARLIRLVELAIEGRVVGAGRGVKCSVVAVTLGFVLTQIITIAPGPRSGHQAVGRDCTDSRPGDPRPVRQFRLL